MDQHAPSHMETGWQICFYSCRSDRFWLFCLSIFKIFITGGRNVAWYQTKTHTRFVDFKYFQRSIRMPCCWCIHTINIKDWFTNYRQRRKIMIYCRWNAWKESVVHQSSQREANNSGDFYLPKMRRALCANFAPKEREGHKLTCLLTFDGKNSVSIFASICPQ